MAEAPILIADPIPLAPTLPLGRTFARPVRTRPRIDQSGVSFGGYVFLDLEVLHTRPLEFHCKDGTQLFDSQTNDAMKTPRETRILEIAICATNEEFEPLDTGFQSLVHWEDMTVEQLRAEMVEYVLGFCTVLRKADGK